MQVLNDNMNNRGYSCKIPIQHNHFCQCIYVFRDCRAQNGEENHLNCNQQDSSDDLEFTSDESMESRGSSGRNIDNLELISNLIADLHRKSSLGSHGPSTSGTVREKEHGDQE